jgi:DNA repair exonuclease SbcCD ATPase subunit
MNMSCKHGKGLDLAVLDELMGSLDRLGVQKSVEALNSLGQTILAISHVEPKQVYVNTIKIVKEKGYSRIKKVR